ncbi:uncharacterized protein LOC113302778 isoform X4 [Papaver somniferum]|uniref:uncharacterized protein LOC113302778 isoform X3 n=1 Tax=Papaver somniferum TaxID=3469 RepID=UPI000E702475|nr:uncharacterized protein LOC113302778 isoform X3 [Papaver somniferum]XP_026407514.1 uncharacterized protein LOC113302778 isoform X4 [Papaver somniferum]
MADPHNPNPVAEEPSTAALVVPLIDPNHNIIRIKDEEVKEEELTDTELEENLQKLNNFLLLFGFHQCSLSGTIVSWVAFAIIGVSVPVLILLLPSCSGCEKYQINKFELDILASQSLLAAISLLCVSHNLRKHGIRKFLFVDRYHGHMGKFREEYVKMIQGFFSLLVLWIIPCFVLKTVREVIRVIYVDHESWWISVAILFALLSSWAYSTIISLSASVLLNLVCNLQVIHFADYTKLLESDSDVIALIDEHVRLRHHLSKISHRFRIFLLLEFLVVTCSQVVTLFQTTGYHGIITLINGGDFAVSSIVQVVGIVICLHATAKISHRAQRVASVASRWHALVTSNSPDPSRMRGSNSVGNFEALANPIRSIPTVFSESDLESLDSIGPPNYTQLASHVSSYNKRQAFVLLCSNVSAVQPAGVTIYGWTVDRELINTVFLIEFSLILFVLGKTMIFT